VAFLIKQNDRRPYLPAQFFLPDGETPLDLTSVATVNLAVRPKGSETVSFKKPCVIVDAPLGEVEYRWSADDTAEAGEYEYEFEITWPDAEPQTIPTDTYFALVVVDDIA
jgi:hypothetical protein